jgi:hypothetical protein
MASGMVPESVLCDMDRSWMDGEMVRLEGKAHTMPLPLRCRVCSWDREVNRQEGMEPGRETM